MLEFHRSLVFFYFSHYNNILICFTDEFHRAVKICTGTSLSKHLVHTVFAIFDEDGDGQLSYREFIAIMKDRLNRGFKVLICYRLTVNDCFKNIN